MLNAECKKSKKIIYIHFETERYHSPMQCVCFFALLNTHFAWILLFYRIGHMTLSLHRTITYKLTEWLLYRLSSPHSVIINWKKKTNEPKWWPLLEMEKNGQIIRYTYSVRYIFRMSYFKCPPWLSFQPIINRFDYLSSGWGHTLLLFAGVAIKENIVTNLLLAIKTEEMVWAALYVYIRAVHTFAFA